MIKHLSTFDRYRVVIDDRVIHRVNMLHFLGDQGRVKSYLILLVLFMLVKTIVWLLSDQVIVRDRLCEERLTVLVMDGWMTLIHRVDHVHANRV